MKIGILGSGQLGRMLAQAGAALTLENRENIENIEFVFFDKAPSKTIEGLGVFFNDLPLFLKEADIITYESENIDLPLAQTIIDHSKILAPGIASLEYCQDRLKEKGLFDLLEIPTPRYCAVSTVNDLQTAIQMFSFPMILKTTQQGYDGKGQIILRNLEEALQAWPSLTSQKYIAEQYISFQRELSLIAVRGRSGNIIFYPMAENLHTQGILQRTLAPAGVSHHLATAAQDYVTRLLQHLNHVGVFTLEFFDTPQGLLANECAPRVHNSGHWTIEGSACSQFENHLRAIAGLPLGDTTSKEYMGMVNLLGKIPSTLEQKLLDIPNAFLHDYQKLPRSQRKLGHITVNSQNHQEREHHLKTIEHFLNQDSVL